jgi:hypothetical protein
MYEVVTCSRDCSCGSRTTIGEDDWIGAGAELTGVTIAALCATTHNEQCEAGED